MSDTGKHERSESPITFRCPPEAVTLMERVRKERGARSRTTVILRAIFNYYSPFLSKRERAAVERFLKEAA